MESYGQNDPETIPYFETFSLQALKGQGHEIRMA